jgi:hypothetical protein
MTVDERLETAMTFSATVIRRLQRQENRESPRVRVAVVVRHSSLHWLPTEYSGSGPGP